MRKNAKKSVILVFHDSGLSGGTLALLDLIENWSKNGLFKYVCVLPKHNIILQTKLEAMGCDVVELRAWRCIWNGEGSLLEKTILLAKLALGLINTHMNIKRKVKNYDVRAVYTNTSSIYHGISISKILGVPHIWHIREFVTKEHNVYPILGEKLHYHILGKYSDQLIFISKSLAEEYGKHINSEKVCAIYDDLSPKYRIDEFKPWETRKHNILVVGDISKGKCQATVIDALPSIIERHPDVKLYFAGKPTDEGYFEELNRTVEELKLEDYVTFLGHVDDMNELRKTMGIGIVPSYKEAFGRITIEGMLSGMIMIGSNNSGTKELIDNGVTGYLFDLDDTRALANMVNAVLEKTDESNKQMIDQAKDYAQKFIVGNCAQEIHNMFIKLGE